jgi:hypothetical protein
MLAQLAQVAEGELKMTGGISLAEPLAVKNLEVQTLTHERERTWRETANP